MFPQTHLVLVHFSFVLTFESMQSSHMAYLLHVIKRYTCIYRYTYILPWLTLKFELRILFMEKVQITKMIFSLPLLYFFCYSIHRGIN